MKNSYKNYNFSLIELLTVLAITAVIISISIPAFNTLLKGESVEQASRTVLSELKLARAFAITNEAYVGVIMCDTGLPLGYRYSAYRVCELNENNFSYSFNKWIDGEKWEFLPIGASFINSTTGLTNISGVKDTPIGLSSSTINGIIFKPSGECNSSASVIIGAGTESGATNESNQIVLEVNQFTGRASYVGN